MPPQTQLPLDPATKPFLAPFLPPSPPPHGQLCRKPYTTLTYATSLDAQLAASPGVQTKLSGSATKALTHYLRTQHAAILIGAATAIADDPGLNSRLSGEATTAGTSSASAWQQQQPRPVIVDPHFRWGFSRDARCLRAAREGGGLGPYVLVSAAAAAASAAKGARDERVRWLQECGGDTIVLDDPPTTTGWEWAYLLDTLAGLGLHSVMVEGGGRVINDLLRVENRGLVDAVVVTVAPVYLGRGGVAVCPEVDEPVRFRDVQWAVLGSDVVMAARIDYKM